MWIDPTSFTALGEFTQSTAVVFHRNRTPSISMSVADGSFLLRHSQAYPATKRDSPTSSSLRWMAATIAGKSSNSRNS